MNQPPIQLHRNLLTAGCLGGAAICRWCLLSFLTIYNCAGRGALHFFTNQNHRVDETTGQQKNGRRLPTYWWVNQLMMVKHHIRVLFIHFSHGKCTRMQEKRVHSLKVSRSLSQTIFSTNQHPKPQEQGVNICKIDTLWCVQSTSIYNDTILQRLTQEYYWDIMVTKIKEHSMKVIFKSCTQCSAQQVLEKHSFAHVMGGNKKRHSFQKKHLGKRTKPLLLVQILN